MAGSSDSAVAATALSNACVIQNDLGEYKAALPDCRRALEACRTLGDPETLGRALNTWGWCSKAWGRRPRPSIPSWRGGRCNRDGRFAYLGSRIE
jgi:hypothetical protein